MPESPRLTKLRKIVADHQSAKIDGVLMDALTARAILQCYVRGGGVTRRVIESKPIHKVAACAWQAVRASRRENA